MLRIYLARHGQNEDNAEGLLNGLRDRPLTAIGLDQARQLAEHIKAIGLQFDRVYSSPLSRAYVTAETITDVLGMEKPEVMQALIERDFGSMSGRPAREIEAVCAPDILKTERITYFLSPEGAETFPQLLERGHRVLDEVRARHTDGSILLVGHGDMGKMIYAAYYGLNWKDVLCLFHFGNSELILLSPDSKPEDVHVFKQEQFNG